MLGEAAAFVLQARDEERVHGIRAANDGGFFLGENTSEQATFAAKEPKTARHEIGAIDPSVEAAPEARGAVDGRDVGAATDLIEAWARQGEQIDHPRRAWPVIRVASSGERAGGGVVTFAVAGG